MTTHRIRYRGRTRLLITHGAHSDASGFFLNVYCVGNRTHFMGRTGGRFYHRTVTCTAKP